MAFGNCRNEIGRPSKGERGRETTNKHADVPPATKRLQGNVDRPRFLAISDQADVTALRVAMEAHLAFAQRVILSDDANEAIMKKQASMQGEIGAMANDARFEVDSSLAQRRACTIGLGQQAKEHARRCLQFLQECRPEILHEAFARPQRECAIQSLEVKTLSRTQNLVATLHELADPRAQLESPGRGDEAPPGSNEQGVTRRFAQARQRPTHGRGAEFQALGCPRHAAFGE